MREKVFTRGRKWLNPPLHADTGAIAWSLDAQKFCVSGEYQIRDCGRQITLDFYMENNKDLKERTAKLDILISSLTLMRDNLAPALEHYKKLKASQKQKPRVSSKVE